MEEEKEERNEEKKTTCQPIQAIHSYVINPCRESSFLNLHPAPCTVPRSRKHPSAPADAEYLNVEPDHTENLMLRYSDNIRTLTLYWTGVTGPKDQTSRSVSARCHHHQLCHHFCHEYYRRRRLLGSRHLLTFWILHLIPFSHLILRTVRDQNDGSARTLN